MRFFFVNIIILFSFINFSEANNDIRFIDINYIVNNSISGKNLNQIIEKKNDKITSELNSLGKKLEQQKNKIVSQKNILKKEDLDSLVKVYEKEVQKFNEIRKKKKMNLIVLILNQKKKLLIY